MSKALVERGKSKKGRRIEGGALSNKKKEAWEARTPGQNHLQTTSSTDLVNL